MLTEGPVLCHSHDEGGGNIGNWRQRGSLQESFNKCQAESYQDNGCMWKPAYWGLDNFRVRLHRFNSRPHISESPGCLYPKPRDLNPGGGLG